jgi:hypothetical protein
MTWDELESAMFRYHMSLPEPKKTYVDWWYSEGGIKDMLLDYHKPENGTCPKCGSDLGHYPNCPNGICFIKEAK